MNKEQLTGNPKTSTGAIVALITPVIIWMVSIFGIAIFGYAGYYDITERLAELSGMGFFAAVCASWALIPVTIFISSLALWEIIQSKGKLTGYRLVVEGIILSFILIPLTFAFLIKCGVLFSLK